VRVTAPIARDAGAALLLAAASLLVGASRFMPTEEIGRKLVAVFGTAAAWHDHVLWWWLAAVPAVVALLLRRHRPLVAYACAAASTILHIADPTVRGLPVGFDDDGFGLLPMDLAALICLATLATTTRRRRTGLIVLAVSVAVLYALAGASLSTATPALLLVVAWAVGDGARVRRLHLALSEQHIADLRRERDQRAALAVAAERARISRELHDVVAHGMSVMVVQAQAAAAALRPDPDTAEIALTHVVGTGRASLAEMRRLLGLIRDDTADAALSPPVGLAALPVLVDEVRSAGTAVDLHVEGEPVPLPAAVDLSTYRIVQEALTNTRRHAGPGARATVRLRFHDHRLDIEVADDGIGAPPHSPTGNGLRGIAERVGALGGTLSMGPREDGGFRVRAQLPMTADT
jgi:signal transduction histidine kinase